MSNPSTVFVFLAVLFGILGYRRRRLARANLVYVQQPRPGDGAAFDGNPYGYGGSGGGPPPQYPPQVHYDPTTGFAPVRFKTTLPFLLSSH